jgi:hypothetical protein
MLPLYLVLWDNVFAQGERIFHYTPEALLVRLLLTHSGICRSGNKGVSAVLL